MAIFGRIESLTGAGLAFLLGLSGISPALGQEPGAPPAAGRLKCDVAGGVSFFVGSARALDCVFTQKNQPDEYYKGTIKKIGVDVGYQKKGVIVWDVVSPGLKRGPGALEGKYVGATADVALIGGVSANALIGGNKVVLNPVSLGAQRGINIAAGIGGIELAYVNLPAPALRDWTPVITR